MIVKNLIVNADDLGRTLNINKGIEIGYLKGIVSSASLVASSQAFDDAVDIAHRNPNLGIGVHLTLHEYPPLLESLFLKKLSLLNNIELYLRITRASNYEINLIEENFILQINKIVESGIQPTHLDGHNHMHVHPRLSGVLKRIIKQTNITNIRMPFERISSYSNIASRVKKWTLASASLIAWFRLNNVATYPKWFHGLSNGGSLNINILEDMLLKKVQPGINELMCHIGIDNDDPPFSIGYKWQNEFSAMTKYSKKEILSLYNINIISYKDIKLK